MKLLIVSQHFYPENFRVNDLAEAMVARGHSVTVLTGTPNYPTGQFFPGYGLFRRTRENWHGVEIVRSPLIPRGSASKMRLAVNYASFALAASVVGILRLRRNFDAIVVHETSPVTVGIPAVVMKWLTGAPILFWVLDLWPEYAADVGGVKSPRLMSAISGLTRWIYRHCDRVLVQSRGFIPSTRRMGVDEECIRYFPSWAESLYVPSDQDPPVQLPPGFRVMFAGNVGECQDFPAIIAAAERTLHRPDVQWVIIGDGRMMPWVRENIARRGLARSVHILGQYPVETMPAFFAHADVLLTTLKPGGGVFALTIPGKIQSYLACGRPILAMLDGEGARVVEESGAGLSCPAGDAEKLAQNVLYLANLGQQERRQMGERGRAYYDAEFNREVAITRLESWIEEVIRR